jgi:hypothetical protein
MLLPLAAVLTPTVVAAEPIGTSAGSHGAVAGTVTSIDASGKAFDAPGVRLTLTLTCAGTPDTARVSTSARFAFATCFRIAVRSTPICKDLRTRPRSQSCGPATPYTWPFI